MKTLKITLALVVVALLTVSFVQSEGKIVDTKFDNNENSTQINLLAHKKTKLLKPTRA